MRHAFVIIALTAVSLGCFAQTRVATPLNLCWPPQPTNPSLNDSSFVNMVRIQVNTLNAEPVVAAQATANWILADIAAGRLAADGSNCCVLLFGWGHNQTSDVADQRTRFFREEDSLPGVAIEDFPEWQPNQDPIQAARPYRHPWLVSASSPTAPLKVWTEQYMQAFAAIPGIPDPALFLFDVENFIAYPRGKNPVWLLNHVAGTSLWTTPIPGYPLPGQTDDTASELYATAAASYGWPSDIRNGIDVNLSAQSAVNRPYLAWWVPITSRVLSQVMTHCAYGPIHTYFPNALVGNYGESHLDGQPDSTSWFMDRDCPNESCTTRHEAKQFVRGWIDRSRWGAEFFKESTGRWIVFPQRIVASPNLLFCPELYPLNPENYNGDNAGPGHKLPNPYRGGNDESMVESTLRLDRHSMESAINSGSGANQAIVRP